MGLADTGPINGSFGLKTMIKENQKAQSVELNTTTMATSTSRVLSRLSSCRLHLLSQTKLAKPAASSLSPSTPRISRTSRLPVELACIGLISMVPLHSAVASARLVSSLSVEAPGWCLVPQGISMPL
ncbi:uncharacterized protein LOC130738976 [Lotus japonicus]|uniref:uncharacterized protein LOC130738976 n=1 Tax=Lotus japonicus TaxID=34305 RepID=UPI00258317A8|nr:uncharacterized protein LOC130738976 [Lotus japonicus]